METLDGNRKNNKKYAKAEMVQRFYFGAITFSLRISVEVEYYY